MKQFKNLQQFLDHFKDEEVCRNYLEQQRWGGTPACPFCGVINPYRTNRGFKCRDKQCHKKFSVTVGTVYENSKVPLCTWFAAIYLATSSKKGISSLQAGRQLGITQKTAWFLNHRIREMLKAKAPQMLKNMVEVDETYIGGKAANKHKAQRRELIKKGTGMVNRTPVFGVVERLGNMVLRVPDKTDGETLKPIIRQVVDKNAVIVSDGFGAYKDLHLEFAGHEIVNHQQDEYVRGIWHTNTIEGFFAILKRGIYGIYHQVSSKHLQRYCDEFAYRYNTRTTTDDVRFSLSLQNSDGRLKYNQLIGKA